MAAVNLADSTQYAGNDIPIEVTLTAADSNSLVGTAIELDVRNGTTQVIALTTTAGSLTKTTETSSSIVAKGVIPKTLTATLSGAKLKYCLEVVLPNTYRRTLEVGSFKIKDC